MLCALLALAPTSLWVSPNGLDTNPGTEKRPLKTLEGLRAVLAGKPHAQVEVRLSGRIGVQKTATFGAEAHDVTFKGGTIGGGTILSGWKPDIFMGRKCWSAPCDGDFMQLFVGKERERAWRPRIPATGFHRILGFADPKEGQAGLMEGQKDAILEKGDLKGTEHNFGDIEFVVHELWIASRMPIEKTDPETGLTFFKKKAVFTMNGASYYLDNVAEAFGQPGQWYLDRRAKRVYYTPRASDKLPSFEALAPGPATLLRLEGSADVKFDHVQFEGAEFRLPADSSGDVQAAFTVPGAIQIQDSRNVVMTGCTVAHVGGYGVQIDGSSRDVVVAGSHLFDLGAGGVIINNGPDSCTISDNVIEHGGRVYPSGIGVIYRLSGNNKIVHNRISDFYYTGISGGWDWGFADTQAKNNLVAYNDIFQIGQDQLSDMGGIYVLGKQPGSLIHHNRIHDVSSLTYGGWGIYLDEGSTGWTVHDNVVWNTKTGGFHIHYGGNNLIRNNIFAYARTEGQLIRQRDDKQGPIRFENNLVIARPGDAPIIVSNWLRRDVTMTGMLYAAPKGDLPFGDDGTGRFIQTFLSPEGVLPKDSEAYRFGFKPIDLSKVGPSHR